MTIDNVTQKLKVTLKTKLFKPRNFKQSMLNTLTFAKCHQQPVMVVAGKDVLTAAMMADS